MNNDLTVKENKYIKILKYLLITAISTLPICIYILTLRDINESYIFPIFLNSHFFISFYIFCFTIIFHINNFNKKIVLITFLSFLLISLISSFSNIFFNYVYMPPIDTPDFQILINRSIFLMIILFIIMMLSYNSFNVLDKEGISDFLTVFGDAFIWFLIINTASSTLFTILSYGMIIFGFSIAALFNSSNEIVFIISKLAICIIIFTYSFIPFISYYISIKTKSTISIYISRFLLIINLFSMFVMMFTMLTYESRPYNNRVVYIIYNIILSITIINLMFVRMDKKSNIFTKSMYLIVPIFAFLFDLLTITVSIYRIVNYGLTPNKLTLIILNIIFLVHLIIISINTIVSFKNREDNNPSNLLIDSKPNIFIYVYLLFSFIVCFIIPLLYI
ncbi:hypothetical protein [Brachyspira sp.]|uniref:hypothetical protein n=2 Tax=Brachyspira sp. TaxID=1977261 RepID=UPI0026235648|nr:hypothetical protein [Brachyspira sp.]